jgi:hypothetical protein
MSGFGIHEQYAAAVEMWEAGKSWREESFLHQLSGNGSLLLMANHDALWMEAICRVLGQPTGTSWESLRSLLRSMPAHEARRRLYTASSLWYVQAERLRLRMLARSLRSGAYGEASVEGPLADLGRSCALRARQLTDMAWCLEGRDTGSIAVVSR